MAAVRLNIPAIFVSGGPMLSVRDEGGAYLDYNSVYEAVGLQRRQNHGLRAGKDRRVRLPHLRLVQRMFTANSMNCLSEAVGIALPGNGTIPAVPPKG